MAGELWTFDEHLLSKVLRELDEVEEYRPGHEDTNLYDRQAIDCTDQEGANRRAYTYFYARHEQKRFFKRVPPRYVWAGRAYAIWPDDADW